MSAITNRETRFLSESKDAYREVIALFSSGADKHPILFKGFWYFVSMHEFHDIFPVYRSLSNAYLEYYNIKAQKITATIYFNMK